MPREYDPSLARQVTGLLLGVAGATLFWVLVSYHPEDVPGWFPFAKFASGGGPLVRQTLLGPTGAIIACVVNKLLGVASLFLAIAMTGYGLVRMLYPLWRLGPRLCWAAVFILSAAGLAHLQPDFLQALFAHFYGKPLAEFAVSIDSAKFPGGQLGGWVGDGFHSLFARPGAVVLLCGLYMVSLVLMTGIHPLTLLRQVAGLPAQLRERYHRWQLRRADEQGRLELERQRLLREKRKLEKELRRKGINPDEEDERDADADEYSEGKPSRLAKNTRRKPKTLGDGEDAEAGDTLVIRALKDTAKDADKDGEPVFNPDRPEPQVIDTSRPVRKPKREKSGAWQAAPGELFPLPSPALALEDYRLPGLDLLDEPDPADADAVDPKALLKMQDVLIDCLAQFGVAVAPGDITRGPTITRYEVYPAKGVSVDKITSRERDIARATCAERINILAPIPGKDTVGVEIANSKKQKITFRELLESDDWAAAKAKIPLVLGKDVYGKTILGDLAKMPHLLVAGTTGSGKSVCINAIIASILYRFKPDELNFVMIDPKVVEMQVYSGLPHLSVPVVTDPKKVLLALRWVIDQMEERYKMFAKVGVRNIATFNARPKKKTQKELDAEAEKLAAEQAGKGETAEATTLSAEKESDALPLFDAVEARHEIALEQAEQAGGQVEDQAENPDEEPDGEPLSEETDDAENEAEDTAEDAAEDEPDADLESDEDTPPWDVDDESEPATATKVTDKKSANAAKPPAGSEPLFRLEAKLPWASDDEERDENSVHPVHTVHSVHLDNNDDAPESSPETDADPADTDADFAPPAKPARNLRDHEQDIPEGPISYIVVIIDELADLMQTAPADVESAIARITQMGRAAGIHMIVATQTPRADVITGVIKANIPSRIAFQVASGLDSRIILDEKGAERLLGQGDMMYLPPGTSRMTRAQGVLVTDEEIQRLVKFVADQSEPKFHPDIEERLNGGEAEEITEEEEELVQKCIEIMKQERKASTSLFQRRLRLGYARAARVTDILEKRGYIAAGEGAKPREILVDLDDLL